MAEPESTHLHSAAAPTDSIDAPREIEPRDRALFGQALDGVFVVDDGGKILDVNETACALLGEPRTALVARDLPSLGLVNESLEKLRAALRREGERRGEVRLRARDGRPLDAEYLVSVSIQPGQHMVVLRDMTAARRTAVAVRVLAEASGALAGARESEPALIQLVRRLVPTFADWGAVDLVGPDRRLRRIAVAHMDPRKEALAWEMARRFPVALDDSSVLAQVFRTGRSTLVPEIDDALLERAIEDQDYLHAVKSLGLRSSLMVPLQVHGSVLGVLSLACSESGRRFTAEDQAVAEDLGRRAGAALEMVELYAEAQRSQQRATYLAEASEVLSSSLDAENTLAKVAALGVPGIADIAGVYLLEDDGSIRQAVVVHREPRLEALLWEFHRLLPLHIDQDRLLPTVIRTGRAQLLPDIPLATRQDWAVSSRTDDIQAQLGLRSYMAVPLKTGGRVIGAIALSSSTSGRRFGPPDLQLTEELARRVAVALENAQLYRLAQTAHQNAAFIAEVSAQLASSLDYQTTLGRLLSFFVPRMADWALVDLVDGSQGLRRVGSTAHDPALQPVLEELQQRFPPDRGSAQPSAVALRTGQTVELASLDDETIAAHCRDGEHVELMKRLAPTSALAIPMIARGSTIGVINLARTQGRPRYSPSEIKLAEEVAHRAAVALDNAKLFQDAQQASRLKDEFLATVSHELRNPLTAILGWTRLLRNGSLPEDKRQRAMESVERNALSQVQLVEDMLDISRIVSGKLRLAVAVVEPARIVEAALDTVRPAAEGKGLILQTIIDPDAGSVFGDGDRLQQVLWNLLSNAVKFTPRGGRVQVFVRRVDSYIEFGVKDNGQGIPAPFLPHVFERFRQADGTPTRKHGGLGLGLAIVRHIVELHGGTVEALSDGEGLGATFLVRVPVMPVRSTPVVEMRAVGAADEPKPARLQLRGVRVLVVDDDLDARELIAAALEQAGAKVDLVGSAEQAMEILRSGATDVLVSDIGMPGEDGYSLIRRLRALGPAGHLPAVALTAYARAEDRTKALTAGFTLHLTKPVEPTELVLVVSSLAGRFGG